MLRAMGRLLGRSGSERFGKTGVVDPPNVLQSQAGRYFIGRTGLFAAAAGQEALVLFSTPAKSNRRAFVVSITVTSNLGRRAFYYFGAATDVAMQRSSKVTTTHRGSSVEPQATLQFVTAEAVPLTTGVGVFERLLTGRDTLVLEQQGRVIVEPGEAIGVWFEAIGADDEIDVALGWWEEPAGRP